jgi:uncharacterized protein (TIGR01615 family)
MDALPAVFVGDAPRLARLIAWLAALLAQHFERRGMPLPPWRTERALRARWLLREGVHGCWTVSGEERTKLGTLDRIAC